VNVAHITRKSQSSSYFGKLARLHRDAANSIPRPRPIRLFPKDEQSRQQYNGYQVKSYCQINIQLAIYSQDKEDKQEAKGNKKQLLSVELIEVEYRTSFQVAISS
jgi:hypothetical protein